MKKEQFAALLDDLVNSVGQEERHAVVRQKLLQTFTRLQREIDRLEEDVILQAYKK